MRNIVAAVSELIDAGQYLWLEGLARERIVNDYLTGNGKSRSVAGFSVDIEACQRVIQTGTVYDLMIYEKLQEGSYGERLAMDLLIDDARHAADLLKPLFGQTSCRDGWVVLPASQLMISDVAETAEAAVRLIAKAHRENIMISIPGLPHRLPVIEQLMGAGIPVHIGLVFSPAQVRASVQACLAAIEVGIAAGRQSIVPCFITIPVDRLLAGLCNLLPEEAAVEFGNGVIADIGETVSNLLSSRRWERAMAAGAHTPRLIWSFTQSVKRSLPSFQFVNECEEICSLSSLTVDKVSPVLPHDPDTRKQTVYGNRRLQAPLLHGYADIDFATLAERLQKDEADSLLRFWIGFLDTIARKSAALTSGQCPRVKGYKQ
jgi:transaldolase